MKSFFKYVLATVTGMVLTFLLLLVVGSILIGVMVNSAMKDDSVTVVDNSILTMKLDYMVTERTVPNPFEDLDIPNFSVFRTLGLNDILHRLDAAAQDDKIKGILLDLSSVNAGFATMQEIRDALLEFKESGKFIVAYSEYYTQKAYFLASVADQVYIHPEGGLDFKGLATEISFLKGTLDKLGVDMQIVKVGTYKSAVEPLIQDQMSEANREQVTAYVQSIYQEFLSDISDSRQISTDSLHRLADQLLVTNASEAVQYGLADGVLYMDELLGELKGRLGLDEEADIRAVQLRQYKPQIDVKERLRKDRIAVLYAVGEITSGEGSEEVIGSAKIARELRKLRKDEYVKGVVFRINSPGGSALASDVIWREVALLREEKTVIVSMGDVAASGGYYIAAAADSIFAQPNTLTGSIGVFGTIPNMQKLWNTHLGITFDGVKTGKHADFLSGNFSRPLTRDEEAILQNEVNRVYETFIKRVADGRSLSIAQVDSIGQGRVWSGEQAVDIGLVDRLGSLEDAIVAAASKAGVEEYRVVNYPAIKDPFASLLGRGGEQIRTWYGQTQFGPLYGQYTRLQSLLEQRGVVALLPFDITLH